MMIPEATDLRSWAASIIIDFPTDDIPILDNDENWKEWGDKLAGCTTFIENNSPSTHGYIDWKSWAERVFFCMSNN
jgi:hypothetical protein